MLYWQNIKEFSSILQGKNGCIVCIDWGSKYCGLAISNPELTVATTFGIVSPDRLISKIQLINKDYLLKGIVIGLPITLDFQGVHTITRDIIIVGVEIINTLKIPVLLWDERMSTTGAFNMLHFKNVKSKANNTRTKLKKGKKRLDDVAAQFVLDGLLDLLRAND
ncbi:MAG: RuvX/YqgF family protein [Alphaproteobacteria bacterium]|nr:RuvX/YqgF family protein [Rickettsiales bacterium]